jgi:uncharacterized membrane protein YphA (DoxX/SURF4 family)
MSSASPSTNIAATIARILLGLIFFIFGLNFFFHFIPAGPMPEGKAAAFVGGLFQSGYLFPFLKVVEVTSGILLLANRYVPLVLVVLMPISINIFLFHTQLFPTVPTVIISILIIVSQLYLAWVNRNSYRQLFISRPAR